MKIDNCEKHKFNYTKICTFRTVSLRNMGICHEEIPTLNLKCCSAKEDYFTYQLKLTQSAARWNIDSLFVQHD